MALALVFFLAQAINGFEIIDYYPKSKSVFIKEGEDLAIWCEADEYWERCKITHVRSANSCEYVWNKDKYNVKEKNCNDFGGRFTYIGDRGNAAYNCGIRVNNMSSKDEGQWKCYVWSYYDGYNKWRSYATRDSKSYEVHIEVKTTTSTSTSTTTPITSGVHQWGLPIILAKDGIDNSTATYPNDQSDQVDSSTVTTVAILMVIILALPALSFLYYAKRQSKCCFRKNQLKLHDADNRLDVECAKSLTNEDNHGGMLGEDEKPESDQTLELGKQ